MFSDFFRKIQKYLFCVLMSMCVAGGSLQAQEGETLSSILPQKEVPQKDEFEFFAQVNETGGYITQTMHQEFWDMMKGKYDEEQRTKIVRDVQNSLDVLKEFQALTWESAKESYFSQKSIKINHYEELKETLLKLESPYFSPQVILENAEKIISASALRSPLDLGAGKIYITPELIEENMIGIKGCYERLKILLSPQWKEEYQEYVLPKINVSILSFYAPDEYHEIISHNDEKIDIHIAQLATNKNLIFEIGAIDYQKGDKKFTDFTPEEKEIYIQEFVKEQFSGYRVASPLMSKGAWRGHDFAKGVASLEQNSIIIMSLIVNDKAFYIKYVADTNLALTGADFNDFTKRIQILEKA